MNCCRYRDSVITGLDPAGARFPPSKPTSPAGLCVDFTPGAQDAVAAYASVLRVSPEGYIRRTAAERVLAWQREREALQALAQQHDCTAEELVRRGRLTGHGGRTSLRARSSRSSAPGTQLPACAPQKAPCVPVVTGTAGQVLRCAGLRRVQSSTKARTSRLLLSLS
jgi:hypothetical protein